MMKRIVDEIKEDIIKAFQIGIIDNMLIKKMISKGFSGAEVYSIELKGESVYRGNYFLKIDTNNEEFENAKKGYCFSKVAKIVKMQKIKEYYVLLMEIAGKSSIEYYSFYDIETQIQRKEAIENILPNILQEETQGKNYIEDSIAASELFNKHLKRKLEKKGVLRNYVSGVTGERNVEEVTGFMFPKDIILPNALAYVLVDALWEDKKISNTRCCVHGDFHGNNLFYSEKNNDYALIDLALYHEDGYIFFDTSYFELSLLLNNFENMELLKWVHFIGQMSNQEWNNVECMDKQVFVNIHKCEDQWLNGECNSEFNYKDNLIEARYIARVIVGLNYAGKRAVSNEIRKKSFLYACIYMKKLLELKGVSNYAINVIEWKEIQQRLGDKIDEIDCLLKDVENFCDNQKYILVLGNKYDYDEKIYDALSRIKWSGIVSFRRTEGIEKSLKKQNVLNVLTVDDDCSLLKDENCWCVYADGIEYNPNTIKESFSQWRNKYNIFFGEVCKKIDLELAPDDLQFLIDLESFSDDYIKRLNRFCENMDLLENVSVNMIFLSPNGQEICSKNDFERVDYKSYVTDISAIANFCLNYLKGYQEEEELLIPALNGIRVRVPEEKYKFIKSYVSLLHNRVIQYEGKVTEQEKKAFYYGKEILWQSIEEKLYVNRKELEEYKEKIDLEIEKDENQFLIRIIYSPGAGASVLCRVLAWEYRNKYPVVVAENMNKNINESIQMLYSISGKRILLFLDGDFSENDVGLLLKHAHDFGVKTGIVFLCRNYSNAKLKVLSINDGLKFSSIYSRQMEVLMDYSKEVIEERKENMKKLATLNSLINYRMPFFFGINAFEKDLVSIQDYLNKISSYIDGIDTYKKIINYIALITYYTEGEGLGISYIRKILQLESKTSFRDILKILNGDGGNYIYYSNGSFKVCHSVVALEILEHNYSMNSAEFEKFLEEFVEDMCSCEKKGEISNKLKELFMKLFVKRDIEGDIADNMQRKNFSPLILALKNSYLQEEIFAFLVNIVPDNAHFRQHYGRLIIYNNPGNLEEAKEQFDEAICLDRDNPLHYHARGNMYTKYIMNLCRNKYKDSNVQDLYDNIALLTNEAIYDYETSVQLIVENKEAAIDLSYPYASIVQTSTYIVHQLFLRHDSQMEEKEFLELSDISSKWCRELIQKAKMYDMSTENRYDVVRNSEFYNKIRLHLAKYNSTHKEIGIQLQKHPNDIGIMKEFLYTLDTKKEKWNDKSQEELQRIIGCCNQLMKKREDISEGVMWRWFNACINCRDVNVTDILAILETQEDVDTNLTIQFMLYTIKLGVYFNNQDDKLILEIKEHIESCKKLNANCNRTNTRYYYNGEGNLGICYEREKGMFVKGIVIKWDSPQNGHVSLDVDPRLQAFFVPSVIGMKEEGAIGTKVKFKVGVSFDGLRAWDVEIIYE